MAGKNSQIHLFLETELKEMLEKEASRKEISVSELCRLRLRGGNLFDEMKGKIKSNSEGIERIERMLDEIIKKI